MMPNKKVSEVKLETLQKKFKKKDFARNVKRENVLICEEIGFTLDEFLQLSINALQKISDDLGL